MKICIIGAGAVGGLLGTRLLQAGQDVSFIDTGKRLTDIQSSGLHLLMQDGTTHRIKDPIATSDYTEIGPQDLVILAVKAHQIHDVALRISPLLDQATIVLTLQNGMPWWYFQRHGNQFNGHRLKFFDPNQIIEKYIGAERIIGCVAYTAAAVTEAGVIQHIEGDRFPVGELDGSESSRCQIVAETLTKAGFRSRVITDIRAEIWLKTWGSLTFNPISALTHATMVDICQFPETRALVETMMKEAQAIANKLGIVFRHTIEKRIAGAESVGAHKTSMLQDIEMGHELEIEALIGSIVELAQVTNTPAPAIEAVYACTKLLDKTCTEANACVSLTPMT